MRPSAEREGLQPASELGHLSRQGHGLHVSRALPPRLAGPPDICSRTFSSARCAHTPLARRLPPPSPQLAPHRVCVPCLRPSAGRGRLQPAPELGHLPSHEHAQLFWGAHHHVWGALLPAPSELTNMCSLSPSAPLPCTPPVHHDRAVHPREAARASPFIPRTPSLRATRQRVENSLSAANKLFIRCAWEGYPIFASSGYGSSWAPGSCA